MSGKDATRTLDVRGRRRSPWTHIASSCTLPVYGR